MARMGSMPPQEQPYGGHESAMQDPTRWRRNTPAEVRTASLSTISCSVESHRPLYQEHTSSIFAAIAADDTTRSVHCKHQKQTTLLSPAYLRCITSMTRIDKTCTEARKDAHPAFTVDDGIDDERYWRLPTVEQYICMCVGSIITSISQLECLRLWNHG